MKFINYFKALSFIAVLSVGAGACTDEEKDIPAEEGQYTQSYVSKLDGFPEEKASIWNTYGVSEQEFIRLSTDSAWALPKTDQQKLMNIRNDVSRPNEQTLLQKVIPLEDLTVYMDNVYGGTIGGFVCEAADVKSLKTMHDIYWGLRLDYAGTKFKENGAGYAVIRFYSESTASLNIPYVAELGGTQNHSWPNGGGGFITSTLGEGGYPEWTFNGYYAPKEGAELYEVTPLGKEILRSVYTAGRWQTYEGEEWTTSRQYTATPLPRWCQYQGHTFMIRGEQEGVYQLATYQKLPFETLEVLEKGVYGIKVPVEKCQLLNTFTGM